MSIELITPKETAASLRISMKTLRAHVKAGTLVRVVTGAGKTRAHYAFDPADIEAFIRRRKDFGSQPCPSTSQKARRTGTTISSSDIVDFQALRRERKSRRLAK